MASDAFPHLPQVPDDADQALPTTPRGKEYLPQISEYEEGQHQNSSNTRKSHLGRDLDRAESKYSNMSFEQPDYSMRQSEGPFLRQIAYKDSFKLQDHSELIDNECTQAMQRERRGSAGSITESLVDTFKHRKNVDWSKQKNKERLRDLRDLIRSLFWAFQGVEHLEHTDHNLVPKGIRLMAHRIVRNEVFSAVYLVLTVYALFGPDLAMSLGHTPQNPDNVALAVVNTVVLGLFLVEELFLCLGQRGYLFSGRFWIDTVATISILGDTWIGNELIKSDAAVAGRGSRLVRLVRLGGRSTRMISMMRLARVTQVLRLVPMIQEYTERSTNDLALLLWHKRMRHVFQYVDKQGNGVLTEEDLDFLDTAMLMEFPVEDDANTSVTKKFIKACKSIWVSSAVMPDDSAELGTFRVLAPELFRSSTGKKAFNRCLDDIHCMKESCAMVENAISRLTLKVCVLVLLILIMMQVLESNEGDLSMAQGLRQLEVLAGDPQGASLVCSMVLDDYSKAAASSTLLFLTLHGRVFWSSNCLCRQDCAGSGPQLQDGGVSLAEATMQAVGHESHEFSIQEILSGSSQVRSLAMFDIHRSQREGALLSLAQTASVVVLLLALVIYFASDMKRLSNNNVLHPLWDLMDDMCALKSIEVVGEQRLPEDDMNTLVATYLPHRSRWLRWRCRQHIPVADELVQLRRAFDKLRMAMLSWSKFVPVVLLKQLFEAGVEAKIGCSHCEVSVFFCDIDDFKELCEGSKPREVLQLLETVLSQIYEALADNGGTLLEFIGDEVLAVFNAPCPTSKHALCAVSAALEAQERLDNLPGVPVRLRCSVHRAQVLAGNIGSPSRMKYGALGDGVNLAARLKSLNTRYGTHLLVSSDTLSFAKGHEIFVTRPIGKLVLKGRTTPTLTYEVLGKRSLTSAHVITAAETHQRGFDMLMARHFAEAKSLFDKVPGLLLRPPDVGTDSHANCDELSHVKVVDRPSQHLCSLCDKYLGAPPPDGWDGSEHLKKKAW